MALTKPADFNPRSIIDAVIEEEGGYVNHPNDPGGETNMGITLNTAKKNQDLWSKYGFTGNMRRLPRDLAVDIYLREYWSKMKCDDFLTVHPMLAYHVFDLAVNGGVGRIGQHIQEHLNAQSEGGKRWPLLKEDGVYGAVSHTQFMAYLNSLTSAGRSRVVTMLMDRQEQFYNSLVNKNAKYRVFLRGWLGRVNRKRALLSRVFGNA